MPFKISRVNPDKAIDDALLKYEQSLSRNIIITFFLTVVISLSILFLYAIFK